MCYDKNDTKWPKANKSMWNFILQNYFLFWLWTAYPFLSKTLNLQDVRMAHNQKLLQKLAYAGNYLTSSGFGLHFNKPSIFEL